MPTTNRNRVSRVETLEDRRLLTVFNPPPPLGSTVIVAPPGGLPPILLPPGTELPPGTTAQPAPPVGQLPPGLPPIVGSAEQIALNSFATFQAAHPTATPHITDHLFGNGVFTLTLSETEGRGHSFKETITETKNGIAVDLVVADGRHQEMLASTQATNGAMKAVLADAVFDNGHLTSSIFETQLNGKTNVRQFP